VGYGYGYRYHPRYDYRPYARSYGVSFRSGVYYPGRAHYHWSRVYYSPRYRAAFYYDPSTLLWYYWYAPAARFYPASYIPYAVPTPGPGSPERADLPRAAPATPGAALPPGVPE